MLFLRVASIWILGLHLVACKDPDPPEPSTTDASGSASTEPSGSSGDACGPEELDLLGHCYHQVEVPTVLTPTAVAAADFDDDGVVDLVMECLGEVTFVAICHVTLDGEVTRMDLDWINAGAHIYAADFDADGRQDVVVSTLYRFAVFSVDEGGFTTLSEFQYDNDIHEAGDRPMYPAVPIDVDQDGRAEVVTGGGENGIPL